MSKELNTTNTKNNNSLLATLSAPSFKSSLQQYLPKGISAERLELQAKLAKVNLNKVINFHIANSLQELDYSTDSEEEIVQYIKQDRMS